MFYVYTMYGVLWHQKMLLFSVLWINGFAYFNLYWYRSYIYTKQQQQILYWQSVVCITCVLSTLEILSHTNSTRTTKKSKRTNERKNRWKKWEKQKNMENETSFWCRLIVLLCILEYCASKNMPNTLHTLTNCQSFIFNFCFSLLFSL